MKSINLILLGLALSGASLEAAALEMENAIVIESSSPRLPDQLVITGRNMNIKQELQLTLGGTPIQVVDNSRSVIVADIPLDVLPGNYVLIAWSGGGRVREDSMDITIGAVGPEGPEGAEGPEGPRGARGATGRTGATGATGAQGQQGEPGLPGQRGERGLIGETGPVGPEGPEGPEGAPGPRGPAGVGLPPSCQFGQVAVWDGGAWACADAGGLTAAKDCPDYSATYLHYLGVKLDITALGVLEDFGGFCGGGLVSADISLANGQVRGNNQGPSNAQTRVTPLKIIDVPQNNFGDRARTETIEVAFENGGSFSATTLRLTDLILGTAEDIATGDLLPGSQPIIPRIMLTRHALDYDQQLRQWFEDSFRGPSERTLTIQVNVSPAAHAAEYFTFQLSSCIPRAYELSPTGPYTPDKEAIEIVCGHLVSITSPTHPKTYEWVLETLQGIESPQDISLNNSDGQTVASYEGVFPVRVRFPAFAVTEELTEQTVTLQANQRIFD